MPSTPEKQSFRQMERHLEQGRLDLFERALQRAHANGIPPVWQNPTAWGYLPLETVTELREQRLRLWRAAAQAPDVRTVTDVVTTHPCLDLEREHWQTEMEETLRRRPLALADWLMGRPGIKAKLKRQDNPLHAFIGAAAERKDADAVKWLWRQADLSPPQDTSAHPVLLEITRMTSLEPKVVDMLSFLIEEQKVKPVMATEGPFKNHTPLTQLTTFYVAWRQGKPSSAARDALHDAGLIRVWPLLVNAGDDPHRRLKDLPHGAAQALAPYPAGQADVIMHRLATASASPPERPRRTRLRS